MRQPVRVDTLSTHALAKDLRRTRFEAFAELFSKSDRSPPARRRQLRGVSRERISVRREQSERGNEVQTRPQ